MSKLETVMAKLNKDSVMIGRAREVPTGHGGFSWSLVGLDRMFKTRGVPRGRWTMLVAENNAGKSGLAMQVVAQLHRDVDAGVQKRGMTIYCDSENTFEPEYAQLLGIDVDDPRKLLIMRPDDGIAWLDAVEQLIATGEIDLIVLDSLTFLVPRAMLEADPGKQLPSVQARQNSMLVLRLTGLIARYNVALLVVNHLTGTMRQDRHGNPILEIRGGEMVKNAMSVILWMKKTARPIDEKGNPVTNADMNESVAAEVTIEIYKNKLGRQNYRVPARFVFGSGFDPVYDLYVTAIELGVFESRGAWVSWGENGSLGKWNGKNAAVAALSEDVELFQRVREAVLAADGGPQ